MTPSYNQGRFIEDAIRSVLDQNYDAFEHIIVDGGSTDETLNILNSYDHLRWISEHDDGQSDALNKGFKMATGDVIGWLNADDIYLPGTFKIVSKNLHPESVEAIYSNFRFVNSKGQIIKDIITQSSRKWMSLFYCFIPSTTFFFKRIILDKAIDIDRQFDIAMDKEFFARIYFAGFRISKVDCFFAHFRWHENNKSIDTKDVRKTRLREGIEIFNRYSGFRIPQNKLGILMYRAGMLYCGVYRVFSRTFRTGIYAGLQK